MSLRQITDKYRIKTIVYGANRTMSAIIGPA